MRITQKCQVFTPTDTAEFMLDLCNYSKDLHGKKVLESACGSGNILKIVVERYIVDSLANGLSLSSIKDGLESDIYAFELDPAYYLECLNKLDLLAQQYGLTSIDWKIYNKNVFDYHFNIKFDYIVGNPPYLTYQALNSSERQIIKERFITCKKGKFDYCYAFIEHDVNLLAKNGLMVYLIPSSIFKNVFAKKLREFIQPYLTDIYDYTTIKLFQGKLTSSAIIRCKCWSDSENVDIAYHDISNDKCELIPKDTLADKWEFSANKYGEEAFSSYFKASIVVATLLNRAFLLDGFVEDGAYFVNGDNAIEREIVRPTSSPRTLHYNKTSHIIFPYKYEDGVLVKYTNEQFHQYFPKATSYLSQFLTELSVRDTDKSAEWFEYGRSQALGSINQKKLLISTIITNTVKVYELSDEVIPYSGIYITQIGDVPLEYAKDILESDEFLEYIKSIGIYASGNSIRITSRDVNNFKFRFNLLKK